MPPALPRNCGPRWGFGQGSPMEVLGVIPARYGSSRFPGKVLTPIQGKPLIQWVWERSRQAKRLDQLLVATDDARVQAAVQKFGGEAVMTSSDLPSGTDRVWAAAQGTSAQVIVNIQGDEPLVTAPMIDRLAEVLIAQPKIPMATLRFPMRDPKGLKDPNVVKVVTDLKGRALYFSRAGIPARKNSSEGPLVWYKHIGLYAYRREFLQAFVAWPPSPLEKMEGLEQLRALEHGAWIQVEDSPGDTLGVDTPDDAQRLRQILNRAPGG